MLIFEISGSTALAKKISDNFSYWKCHSPCSELKLLNVLTINFLITYDFPDAPEFWMFLIFLITQFGFKDIGLRFW